MNLTKEDNATVKALKQAIAQYPEEVAAITGCTTALMLGSFKDVNVGKSVTGLLFATLVAANGDVEHMDTIWQTVKGNIALAKEPTTPNKV